MGWWWWTRRTGAHSPPRCPSYHVQMKAPTSAASALVGGGALLPGLTEELSAQLGASTFLSDPMQRVSSTRRTGAHSGQVDSLSRFRSSAAVSIGLTLGAA